MRVLAVALIAALAVIGVQAWLTAESGKAYQREIRVYKDSSLYFQKRLAQVSAAMTTALKGSTKTRNVYITRRTDLKIDLVAGTITAPDVPTPTPLPQSVIQTIIAADSMERGCALVEITCGQYRENAEQLRRADSTTIAKQDLRIDQLSRQRVQTGVVGAAIGAILTCLLRCG